LSPEILRQDDKQVKVINPDELFQQTFEKYLEKDISKDSLRDFYNHNPERVFFALKETTQELLRSNFKVSKNESEVSVKMLQAQENMKDFNKNNRQCFLIHFPR